MSYMEFYKESNEQASERFDLVMERIAEIKEKTDVPAVYDPYFRRTAEFTIICNNIFGIIFFIFIRWEQFN